MYLLLEVEAVFLEEKDSMLGLLEGWNPGRNHAVVICGE